MMVAPYLVHGESRRGRLLHVLPLVALLLCLAGCTSGGDQGQATAPSTPSPRVERQAIDNLLALYQEAVVAEDSDRLQALLAPATVPGPAQTTAVPAVIECALYRRLRGRALTCEPVERP